MRAIIKSKLSFFVKILLTSVILYLIFRKIDFSYLLSSVFRLDIATISLLLISSLMKFYTQYRNWEIYLRLDSSYRPQKNEILKSQLIGSALRFLIPGGYASLGKILYINNKKRYTAFSVGAERIIQTWTAIWAGTFAAYFFFTEIAITIRVVSLVFITLLPFTIYLTVSFQKINRLFLQSIFKFSVLINKFKKNPKPLDESLKEHWNQLLKNLFTIFPTLFSFQIIFVFLTVCQYFFIVSRFSQTSFFDLLISVPLILIANVIPITYAGLGLRETFSIHLLQNFNVLPEIAVTASLLIFFLNSVIPALIGSYFLIRIRKS